MSSLGEQAAFPMATPENPYSAGNEGLTKRDWFAGQALAGLCANADIAMAAAREGVRPTRKLRESVQ